MTALHALDPGKGRSRPRNLWLDAAALLLELDLAASVTAHVGEAAGAAVVLALASPESSTLRGVEAVVGAGVKGARLNGAHIARVWDGEDGGGEGGEDESELHGGVECVLRWLTK